ncbi:MAG: L-2-hydroxyglutarate oxidase, partial [Saprospiraceae bacterium]|nr:L-2-hydroxyglutarate oxidase [Saprospiraceae bacterium]
MQYDIIIGGGGIVGLATALQLQEQRPDIKITVLEKEPALASHQSSRNSGVIHSGIYYKPGSLRAVNCLQGYRRLIEFCKHHHIPFEICGKVIAATTTAERAQLDQILERGLANGLTGIRKISREETKEIEPHVECLESIWVPQAGIIDYGAVANKYAHIFQKNGGEVHVNQAVTNLSKTTEYVVIETANQQRASWEAKVFVNCGGLFSDKLTQMSGMAPGLQIIPFRGEYYDLKPQSCRLVRNLVYPTPNPHFPFLGVHFTRMIQGGIEAGPNAVLAFRREGYSRWQINIRELAETIAFPGFRTLAKKYWREGWEEMKRSYFKAAFVRSLQKLIPEITAD